MTSRASLCGWLESHVDELENIAERRNVDASMIARAQVLVRAIIAEKGLVLYGGQAIDYALRMKGACIYSEDQIPDYDFYSPRHTEVAYELADRLVAEGFAEVDTIRAIHPQTMRVRVGYIEVADVSYVPPAVFGRLPTLAYSQGGVTMKVLHPDFQRIDMHLAFCFPFSGPPREDIFHRYAKDLRRFHMFQEFYPVCGDPPRLEPGAKKTAVVDSAKVAVHGVAAYELLRRALAELAAAGAELPEAARALEVLGECPEVGLATKKSEKGLELALLSKEPLCLVTPWPEVAREVAGDGATRHAPLMDPKPSRYVAGGVEVFTTEGRLLVVVTVAPGVLIVTPQFLMLYFLLESFVGEVGGGARKKLMRDLYVSTLAILQAGGNLLAAMGKGAPPPKFEALVECSPFGLPVRPLGETNRNVAYLTSRKDIARCLGEPPLPGTPDEKSLPPLYFPGSGRARPSFEPAGNPLFEMDGRAL